MNEEKLYSKCITKWGHASQIDMCIEEMAELTQALCKAKRRSKPEKWLVNIYEEIADVTIMIEQMTIIFDGEEIIPKVKKRKLLRLEERLEQ